jgi:ketosteroid isomerase-like protein
VKLPLPALAAVASVLSLSLGCASSQPPPPPPPPTVGVGPSSAALRAELLRTDAAFAALSVARGPAEAFGAYMADDAVEIENGGAFVRGKAAIVAGLVPKPGKTLTIRWEPVEADAAAGGDIGYTYGRCTIEVGGGDAAAKTVRCKYMTVWRKQPDGTWKATVDMGNMSP